MYLLVADETNLQASDGNSFFIYGGLIMSHDQVNQLDRGIREIRANLGLGDGDQLKFSSNFRPRTISPGAWTAAKNRVISLCGAIGVQFIVYVVLHDLARNRGRKELIGYALNTVVATFNSKFLAEKDSTGIVVVDRLPLESGFGDLRERFQLGLELGNGQRIRPERIMLYSATCDGASNLSSAVDIVLGAFRYVVNQQGKERAVDVSKKIFPGVARMMYHRVVSGNARIGDYGYLARPLVIKSAVYKAKYDALSQWLTELVT